MRRSGRLSLFVFIDALGWEILRRRPFLDDELPLKVPLQTVFGYSSTCDPTILTGRLPRDHGHFAFYTFDPPNSPFSACRLLGLLPETLSERGRVRRWVSRAVAKAKGYTGYFHLYNVPFSRLPMLDYTEKKDLYAPGGILSGCPTVFDRLKEMGVRHYVSDWRRGDDENLTSARRALSGGAYRLAYLFLGALDAALHRDGTEGPTVDSRIARTERGLRDLLSSLRRAYDRVDLRVFSDHGMTNVKAVSDLMLRVEAMNLTYGRDYGAVYDATMARFWFPNPAAREDVERLLATEARGRVLSDGDLARYGCDFADRRYGELFFLMAPGVLLCPSYMGKAPLAGMHGYAPEHPDSAAAFAAGPAPTTLVPTRLDDLFGLMLREAAS